MKHKKHLVILLLVGILCQAAFGQTEKTQSHQPKAEYLVNPALTAIGQLHVTINRFADLANYNVPGGELLIKVKQRIAKTGINVQPQAARRGLRTSPIPELIIDIEPLGPTRGQGHMFRIKTSLFVNLPSSRGRRSSFLNIDIWTAGATTETATLENLPTMVTSQLMKQIDAFISDYLAANPKLARAADIDKEPTKLKPKKKKRAPTPSERVAAEYKYVASKKSKVFHKADCRWIKNIKPENITGFNSRGEMVKAGKKACKLCQP